MNIQQFSLEVETRPEHLKEVLLCMITLVRNIDNHRAFGLIKPREASIDFLEFYYVRCEEESIEKYIQEKVDSFFDSWQKKKFEPLQRIVQLSFDERRHKSQLFGFSKVEERVRWEQWTINVSLNTPSGNDVQDKEKLEKQLQKLLTDILQLVNEYKNHIPPLTNKETIPFPYEISFPTYEASSGFFATLGNMLKSPSSTAILP